MSMDKHDCLLGAVVVVLVW